MADTGALFNATAVTTAGGHANLLTTALAAAEWDVVSKAVYNQPMLIKNAPVFTAQVRTWPLIPRFCLVPRALQLNRHEDPLSILGKCREHLQREHAARAARRRDHRPRMVRRHRLGCRLRSADRSRNLRR